MAMNDVLNVQFFEPRYIAVPVGYMADAGNSLASSSRRRKEKSVGESIAESAPTIDFKI